MMVEVHSSQPRLSVTSAIAGAQEWNADVLSDRSQMKAWAATGSQHMFRYHLHLLCPLNNVCPYSLARRDVAALSHDASHAMPCRAANSCLCSIAKRDYTCLLLQRTSRDCCKHCIDYSAGSCLGELHQRREPVLPSMHGVVQWQAV